MNVRIRTIATAAAALATLIAIPAAPALAADRPAPATSIDSLVGTPQVPSSSSIELPHHGTPAHVGATASGDTDYQGVDMSFHTGGAVGLVFVSNDIHADKSVMPDNIPNGGSSRLQMWQNHPSYYPWYGAYGTTTARIYDHGKPTDFWVKMYGSVYWYPYDKAACTIYKGDPAVTGTEVDFSPYACGVTSVDHSDPWQVSFTISPTPATVVTDPATQSALLQAACSGDDAKNDCFYIPTSVKFIQDEPRPYGDPVVNKTDEEVEMHIESKHIVGTEDTIGIEYSSKVTLWEIWSNSLSINYEHTWTDSREFSQSESMKVKPHTSAWFTIGAVLDQITGDFVVRHNGQVFAIHNATVTMPDAKQGAVITPHTAKAATRAE